MRNVLIVFVFFVIASSCPLFADDGEKLFTECQDHFYNGEYQDAVQCFARYIDRKPDDPRGYWRKAYSLYFGWKSVQHTPFPKLDEKARDDFFLLVKEGLRRTDTSDFGLYVKACLLSMRGGVEFNNGGKIRGKWRAKNTLGEVLVAAEASRYQDARYLVGLTNYSGDDHALAFSIAGLPHDRTTGLAAIFQAVAKNQGPFVDDIWFVLFNIETDRKNVRSFNKGETDKIFHDLYAKYPRNRALQEYAEKHP